jgi:hypothetical protein
VPRTLSLSITGAPSHSAPAAGDPVARVDVEGLRQGPPACETCTSSFGLARCPLATLRNEFVTGAVGSHCFEGRHAV